MNTEDHRRIHERLHKALDELVADWIDHTGLMPSEATVRDLMLWSYEQTQEPAEKGKQ